MTAKEILKAARGLISDREHWTTKAYARGRHGGTVPVSSKEACQFCAIGAADRIVYLRTGSLVTRDSETLREEVMRALILATITLGYTAVTDVNDIGGHALTLTMYDRAIEKAA
jgi:hypothetical protein